MRLNERMAYLCLSFLTKYPDLQQAVRTFYDNGATGAYGYHASQLSKKHGIPFNVAAQLSAYMNLWMLQLKELEGTIPDFLLDRMKKCTRTFSTIAGLTSHCASKLCPWCRADKIIEIEGYLAATGAQGCVIKSLPVEDVVKLPRTPPRALLSVKNVVLVNNHLELKIAYFYPDRKARMEPAYKKVIRGILAYDFGLLDPAWINQWFNLVKNMNWFNRKNHTTYS